ncbi:TPA: FHA domain-containing protein [Pseudomonas putida]|nr:FHA domain-containing protein [Pseudomonas putida]
MSTLTLSIINIEQLQHTSSARHEFDRNGGTIGSKGSTWQVDDRQLAIAPIHCEIRWIEGSYCVIDHCQRTYLNDSIACVGAHPPRRLGHGDQLRIGAYRLLVQCTDADTRSLQDLLDPDSTLLDQWLSDAHADAWQPETRPLQPLPEICSAFEPALGNDPLAALDAGAAAAPTADDPLQRLLAGDRP